MTSRSTPLYNRPSGIYILTGFSEKNVTGSANFSAGCPFLSSRWFAFFKHIQMMHAGYVEVAPWKPQTGRRGKIQFFTWYREAKFSLDEDKNPLGRVSLGL